MSEQGAITWAPDVRPPHDSRETTESGEAAEASPNDSETDVSQSLDTATNTQRNTPVALSAQEPADPVDDDYFDVNEPFQYGFPAVSPGLAPVGAQQYRTSNQNSVSSLNSLSGRENDRSPRFGSPSAVRAPATRSSQSLNRGRRSSHSKSLSTSSILPKGLNNERPTYPAQSIEELRGHLHAPRPMRPLRTKSSLPAQNLLYNEMSLWTQQTRDRQSGNLQGSRTVDNTPMSSPGLRSDDRDASASSLYDANRPAHHLQQPTTVTRAEVGHDLYTGNKLINDYEVTEELGRGEHGKVKLGRDLRKNIIVAIKIVPRFSGKRRLGRLGTPEDRTKREVAILKKARHPNVVSLLEVIDDPNKNKVYLVLEFVEKGEIKWRKSGVREVLAVHNSRFDLEREGVVLSLEASEKDLYNVAQARLRHESEALRALTTHRQTGPRHWGVEDSVDDGTDDPLSALSPSASGSGHDPHAPSRSGSIDPFPEPTSALAGSMYGAYTPDPYPYGRKFSLATSVGGMSHMSSEWNFDETDDEHAYVPALTLEEARRTFRDTLTGLNFLHFIGIIHRDIKPANLLVTSTGAVKISDFGVSYLGHPKDPETDPEYDLTEHDVSTVGDDRELARSVGTPGFWAPELCYDDPSMFEEQEGPKITGAIDLWALGVTLYCMVYARLPFYATDAMGLHEAICSSEVLLPKTRLVPVDTTQEKPSSQVPSSINSNKRLDYELKFESVPDAVRDLIRQLLNKEPTRRMTIEQARKHEWVFEGMQDPAQWIKSPDLEKEGKKKILEPDEKEVSDAVSKMNFVEKALSTVGRGIGSLFRSGTRKRAPSAATSASQSSESIASPSGSSASTVGKSDKDKVQDGRRASLRGDEVLTALKTSRENTEHPLAQSQTASPDVPDRGDYFGETFPAFSSVNSVPPASAPAAIAEARPSAPDRAISTLSTAESVRTIKASQINRLPLPSPENSRDARPISQERGLRARVDGLWEGTARTLARLGSRDRHAQRNDYSPASSRHSSESDAHGGASVAVSRALAEGSIEPPAALKHTEIAVDDSSSSPTPPLMTHGIPKIPFQAPASSPEAFEQAQEVNHRRFIQEAQFQAAAKAQAASQPQSLVIDDCPPSPDDLTFLDKTSPRVLSEPPNFEMGSSTIHAGPSASTIASSVDDYGNSSVSQSFSNPSIGVISGASSPPGEGFLSHHDVPAKAAFAKEPEPDFMRTADTVVKYGKPTQTATAPALENWAGDRDDEEDDSDDGMMMSTSAVKKL